MDQKIRLKSQKPTLGPGVERAQPRFSVVRIPWSRERRPAGESRRPPFVLKNVWHRRGDGRIRYHTITTLFPPPPSLPPSSSLHRKEGKEQRRSHEQSKAETERRIPMATSILMAKIPAKATTAPLPQKPRCSPATTLLHVSQEAVRRLISHPHLRSATLSVSTAAAAFSASSALPALAAEIEKAKLFDFNLTLPIIAAEFLVLMFALDKIYFTPLGKFMDGRDAAIREKLNSVKDTSAEVKELDEQAAAIMRAARAEISAALNQMKKEVSAEVDAKLAEGRKKVEAELNAALENLERQKEETIRSLDSQIAALSDEIVRKVLPL